MQSVLRLLYPPQCLGCDEMVTEEGALCGACRRETRFIGGLVCDACGVPLPGEDSVAVRCDGCLAHPPVWSRGRAALLYGDTGRRLVLAFKHGNRQDIAAPAARWMLRAGADLITPGTLVVPVPVHRWRLVKRRYNQAALLSAALSRQAGLAHCPDLLQRHRQTPVLDGRRRDERETLLADAIRVHPARRARVWSKRVLLVDDVMTSGATLNAAAWACLSAGAAEVSVLVMARVAQM